MYDHDQCGLRTDMAGMPLDWITYQEAVRLIRKDVGPLVGESRSLGVSLR